MIKKTSKNWHLIRLFLDDNSQGCHGQYSKATTGADGQSHTEEERTPQEKGSRSKFFMLYIFKIM